MKKMTWLGLFVMVMLTLSAGYTESPAPATRTAQKVVVVALARDATRAMDIEIAVKDALMKRKVSAESLRVVAKDKATTPKGLAQYIREQGYDTLLCMAPRRTILVTTKDKEGGFSTMQNCLSIYLTGNYPSGEPLELDPVIAETAPVGVGTNLGSQRTPIPTNPTAVPLTVYKGTLRAFDTGTGNVIWNGNVHAKMPEDIRSRWESKLLTLSVIEAIEKSGLLLP